MNYIDKKFQELIEEIQLFSEVEIYEHIKEKLKLVIDFSRLIEENSCKHEEQSCALRGLVVSCY